jgi:hypothetical protein
LNHLREHGDTMSMLFMTVRTTSDGMVAGVVPGVSLVLDFLHGPRRGLINSFRFGRFCRGRRLRSSWETWGSEKVSRAFLGMNAELGAASIDECFAAMFGQRGAFAIDFRSFGWQLSNTSLERTREG